jgi:hypothetical protein
MSQNPLRLCLTLTTSAAAQVIDHRLGSDDDARIET